MTQEAKHHKFTKRNKQQMAVNECLRRIPARIPDKYINILVVSRTVLPNSRNISQFLPRGSSLHANDWCQYFSLLIQATLARYFIHSIFYLCCIKIITNFKWNIVINIVFKFTLSREWIIFFLQFPLIIFRIFLELVSVIS